MRGKALVITFADYDDDGRIDFFVGDDGMRDDLFHNHGKMKFTNDALTQGVAMGAYMQAQLKDETDRLMAERYRTPEAVMRETAVSTRF